MSIDKATLDAEAEAMTQDIMAKAREMSANGECYMVLVEGPYTRMLVFQDTKQKAATLAATLEMVFGITGVEGMTVKIVVPGFAKDEDAETVSEVPQS